MADFGVPRTGQIVPNPAPPQIQSIAAGRPVEVPIPKPELNPLPAANGSELEIRDMTALKDALSDRVAEINEILRSARKPIRFRVPEPGAAGEPVVVEVIDPATNEVIRTIPSDKLLGIRNQLEVMMGLVFDREF